MASSWVGGGRATRTLRAGTLALAVALGAGCSHRVPEPAPPAPQAQAAPCPGTSFVDAGEPHPVRVEVENRTGREVRLLLDRCLWWSAVGSVGPGRKTSLRLPQPLLRYGEGLRFQAFTEVPNRWYGTYTSDFGVPIARLVVSPENALPPATLDPAGSPTAGPRSVVIRSGDGGTHVSVFSFDSYAVLTWRCALEGVELMLATPGRLTGDPVVALSVDASEERPFGTWGLVQAFTDGASAPPGSVRPFTEALRGSATATVVVTDARGTAEAYGFSTRDLDSALQRLPCL